MTWCFGLLVMLCQAPVPTQATTVVCPPLVEWSAALQKRAAGELRALPPGSALRQTIPLYVKQRDVLKSCRSKG